MTVALALDSAIALLVVTIAAWVLLSRLTFAAIAGFIAYGLLLALLWVRLPRALDDRGVVALAAALVEVRLLRLLRGRQEQVVVG